LAEKYATWWTFKPLSPLKSYLNEREIVLDEYFCPNEIKEQVINVLRNAHQYSNTDVIMLMDEEQQMVFDSWFIFLPDIVEENIMPHIVAAPVEIAQALQNKHMTADFYMDSPLDIIYKDSSSVFWLPPSIDCVSNKSTEKFFYWNKLLFIFTDFCLNNKNYFTRHSDTILSINENTFLTHIFGFKYFHLSQIENMLKKITKFLGRKNGIIQSCHFMKNNSLLRVPSTINHQVFTFIDDIINNNNNLMPSFPPSGIYL
jgi:hypothetical protein